MTPSGGESMSHDSALQLDAPFGGFLRSPLNWMLLLVPVTAALAHVGAAPPARKNKMNLSVGIALGSCIQLALFVAPVLVLASYFIAPEPLELAFNRAEVGSLLVAVLIGALVCGDGQSNWYKGVQLLTVYAIIALMFYLIPAVT
jgi:Ca2+:H+ antiporter